MTDSSQAKATFDSHLSRFVDSLHEIASLVEGRRPSRDEHSDRLTRLIRDQADACLAYEATLDPETLKVEQARFRRVAIELLQQSWFTNRALTKPRGFSGDYAMLNGLYDQEIVNEGIGGYLDLFAADCDLARAVRSRMESARQFLGEFISAFDAGSKVQILNVASGPCREYFVGLEYPDELDVHITLVDNDPESFSYVENRAQEEQIRETLSYEKYNALRLKSASRNIEKFGRPDLIYSIGLFDYIPDKPLIAIMDGLRQTVRPGGTVYLAFKDELEYHKSEYQWLWDWFFYQRTEEDCRKLMLAAGFDPALTKVERDATGIIINFTMKVPVDAITGVRMDEAHGISPSMNANLTNEES